MKESEIEQKLHLLDALQSSCTQCGICLESCATYQATGWEHESPRGRILLAQAFLEGKIHPSSKALQSFDRCLGCRACEISCPENVQVGAIRNIVQEVRTVIHVDLKPDQECKKWIRLAWRIGSWRWRVYGWRWLKDMPKSKGSYIYTNSNNRTSDITLAVGCIQDLTHHELIEQTIHFLNRLDIQVALEKRQPCCGAIFERLAHFEQAKMYQNKRKSQFNHWMPTPVCFLSQNCQQFISMDSDHHGRMIDLYRLIMQKLEEKNIRLALKTAVEVYYQPYCGQKGVDFAWTLLNQMEGLKIKTLWPLKSCCGGCGGEVLLNPQHASELRESKFKHLPKGAVMVVSSFDCWMQCKQTMQVLYPIQLLFNSELR